MAFPKNIAIVILAAGSSSRMGRPKQLLPWGDTTLLGNAIRTAKASEASAVLVVLGANMVSIREEIQDNCREHLENPIEIVENHLWASGLGSSIACGTNHLSKKKNRPNGIVIMLADQPLIDTAYLNAMISAFDPEQELIVATAYGNKAGVPALFSEAYYGKLSKLEDDVGAKKLINSQKENLMVLDLESRTDDIDTTRDYEKIVKNLH